MQLTTKQDIETGILFALVALLLAWAEHHWLFVLVGAILLGVTLILPIMFRPFSFLWFGLARILSDITSTALLAIIFFLLVTPVGIIRRWMGKDGLRLNDFKKDQDSVLEDRNHTYHADDLKNPF